MGVVLLTVWMFLAGDGFVYRTFPMPDMETCEKTGAKVADDLYGQKVDLPNGEKALVLDADHKCAAIVRRQRA